MSHTLSNMIENTLAKVKEMISVNDVVGTPITTPEGVTIIPISKVSVGFGGGVNVTPVAFIIIKGDSVRMMPVAAPANTTADRVVELVPDVLDKISNFVDSHTEKKSV